MKTIYHLSGLPRSGNTLLSSILNQNPKINTTPLSDLNYLMVESHDKYMSSKLRKNFPDLKSFDNAMSSFY